MKKTIFVLVALLATMFSAPVFAEGTKAEPATLSLGNFEVPGSGWVHYYLTYTPSASGVFKASSKEGNFNITANASSFVDAIDYSTDPNPSSQTESQYDQYGYGKKDFTYSMTAGTKYYVDLYMYAGNKLDFYFTPEGQSTYTVSISSSNETMGTVEFYKGNGVDVTSGEEVGVHAMIKNESLYKFVNWTEDGTQVSTQQYYNFNVTANRTLVANFAEKTSTVSFSVDGANGTLTATAGGNALTSGAEVALGTQVVFTLTPASGYRTCEFTVNGNDCKESLQNNTYTTTVQYETLTAVAKFEQIPTSPLVVTLTAPTNGTLTAYYMDGQTKKAVETGNTVADGTEVFFVAKPAAGYELDKFTVAGEEVYAYANKGEYTVSHTVTASVTASATFKTHTHTAGYEWKSDADKHWHNCGADLGDACDNAKVDEADHTYGTAGKARWTCTVCNYVNASKKAESPFAEIYTMSGRYDSEVSGAINGKINLKDSKVTVELADTKDQYTLTLENVCFNDGEYDIYVNNATTGSLVVEKMDAVKNEDGTVSLSTDKAKFAVSAWPQVKNASVVAKFALEGTTVVGANVTVEGSTNDETFGSLTWKVNFGAGTLTGIANVEPVEKEVSGRKFIQNGRLVIVKGGKLYNAAGALMK